MKKTVILILLFVFVAIGTTSCNVNADDLAEPPQPPAKPDPVKVLEDRIETERQLRVEAQETAEGETLLRERWQLAAFGLGILALVGFLVGTSVGARGKRHASYA